MHLHQYSDRIRTRHRDHGLRNFNGDRERAAILSRTTNGANIPREMAIAFNDRIGHFHAYGYATRKQITLCPRNTIAPIFIRPHPSTNRSIALFSTDKWKLKKFSFRNGSSYGARLQQNLCRRNCLQIFDEQFITRRCLFTRLRYAHKFLNVWDI